MWDAESCEAKARVVSYEARRLWGRYRDTLDLSHLEDMQQEGWVGALGTSPGDPHLPLVVQDSMREYLSHWLHGASRSTAYKTPRRLRYQASLDELRHVPGHTVAPEQAYDRKALVGAIADAATDAELVLWIAQAENGTERLPDATTREMGYAYWDVSRHRQRLKRKARRIAQARQEAR